MWGGDLINYMARLKEKFNKEILPKLKKELGISNIHAVPYIEKITVSMGLGEAVANPKAIENASHDLGLITGQKPLITKAKNAISNFKIRKGAPIGLKVTLRGNRMYEFLDRLVNAVLPRIRDFRGVSKDAFDGKGNYNLGIKENIVFPELIYDEIDKIRGIQITFVTSTDSDDYARALLIAIGIPLRDINEETR